MNASDDASAMAAVGVVDVGAKGASAVRLREGGAPLRGQVPIAHRALSARPRAWSGRVKKSNRHALRLHWPIRMPPPARVRRNASGVDVRVGHAAKVARPMRSRQLWIM